MKKTIAWLMAVTVALAAVVGSALAVTYTEDGGMIVGGDGDDDFSDVVQADPDVIYTVIMPGDVTEVDEYGNPVIPGPGPTFAPGEILDCWLETEEGVRIPVTLLHAGTHFCKVRAGRETLRVPTASLHYEIDGTVSESMRFAQINAKKTGYATMHTRASVKSDVVGRCTTNQIVLVLSVGRVYCKVWCDGDVGYVKRASLTYMNDSAKEIVQAVMTYKGRANSRNAINVRQNGSANSRILDVIPCGTPMEVFTVSEDGWTEVEVSGWRCWVQSKFVTRETETDRYLADLPEETDAAEGSAETDQDGEETILAAQREAPEPSIVFYDADGETEDPTLP